MLLSSLRALRSCTQQRLQKVPAGALTAALHSSPSGDGTGGGASPGSEAPQQPAAAGTTSAAADAATSPADERQRQEGQAHVISIDRSALFNPQPHSHDPALLAVQAAAAGVDKEPETELLRHLKALIQFRGGPLTLAEFMSEVLTNLQHGYYTQRDVFGTAGDFITSPEISQMFGELVGIWCVATWQQLGCPPSLHLVELGPGRGTLMADLLRGTAAFQDFSQALRVSMVEVSPHLRGMHSDSGIASSSSSSNNGSDLRPDPGPLAGASGWGGVPVSWHHSLEEVQPQGPAIYIAHEFLDALPVHQFQKTERGWCERLVDVAAPDSPLHLRFVLSPGPTPAARVLLPRRLRQLLAEQQAAVEALEVCPQGMALAEALAQRVSQHGGAALIVDYGQDGPYEASLQAIRRHEFVGLLEQPGSADLSNRVDYSALRSTVEESGAAADCLGPIPQAHFLLGLGIEARLEALMQRATPEQAEALQAGFRRLVGGSEPGAALAAEGMGTSYQAFCIAQRGLAPWPFGAQLAGEEEEGVAAGAEAGAAHQQGAAEEQPEHPPPPQR
ncbi:hypothetical protein ABPG75_004337 [Micractinium tetrahymenae]